MSHTVSTARTAGKRIPRAKSAGKKAGRQALTPGQLVTSDLDARLMQVVTVDGNGVIVRAIMDLATDKVFPASHREGFDVGQLTPVPLPAPTTLVLNPEDALDWDGRAIQLGDIINDPGMGVENGVAIAILGNFVAVRLPSGDYDGTFCRQCHSAPASVEGGAK